MQSFCCNVFRDGTKFKMDFSGRIDEDSNFPVVDYKDVSFINYDFENLTHINSCGIREFVLWGRKIPAKIKVVYSRCPRILIEQINMIDGIMVKNGRIDSFYVPYFCENCDTARLILVEKERDYLDGKLVLSEFIKCSQCSEEAEIDIIESKYLKFLKDYG